MSEMNQNNNGTKATHSSQVHAQVQLNLHLRGFLRGVNPSTLMDGHLTMSNVITLW